MAFLYVTEQGAKISQTSNRLIIKKEDQKLAEVPLIKIEALLLYGNIQITTQALRCLLDHGIDTVFFNFYGKLYGMLVPPRSKNIVLRMQHFEKARREADALQMALQIVRAKISNMKYLLVSHLKNYSDADISAAVTALENWSRKAEYKQKAQNLLGIEGSATVAYYNAFRKMFRYELRFNGRNRHPPVDEVNALMSYTYAILGNEITMLLNALGLDPYLGFYHGIQYGRPSLAMDMLEPFRPVCDRFVLNLVNLKTLQKSDFENRKPGIFLKDESKRKYFRAYDKFLTEHGSDGRNLRDHIRAQLESLVRFIMDKSSFEPYLRS